MKEKKKTPTRLERRLVGLESRLASALLRIEKDLAKVAMELLKHESMLESRIPGIKKRAASDGCPFCGSTDITGGFVEVSSTEAWQPVACETCDKRWNDIYSYVGYEERK